MTVPVVQKSPTRSDATTPVALSAATDGCLADGCQARGTVPGAILHPRLHVLLGIAPASGITRGYFCTAHNPDRKPRKPRGPSAQVLRNRAAFAATKGV